MGVCWRSAQSKTVVPCRTCTHKKRGEGGSDHCRGATGQHTGEKKKKTLLCTHTGVKRYPPKILACKKKTTKVHHISQTTDFFFFFKAAGYHMTEATATY